MWNLNYVVRNVNDMYNYASQNSLKLLSDYSAEFWEEYVDNYEEYDKIFKRMFKSFVYYDQDITGDNPVEDVTEEFIDAVKGFLFINDKRFTELYRLHIAPFIASPYYNQYITQTKTGYRNIDSVSNSGEREDETSATAGQRTDTNTNQVMSFNSANFVDASKNSLIKGSETDSSTFTKGSQEDTQDIDETNGHTITMQGATTNPMEIAKKYKDMWSGYEFYSYIFKEICKEFLLIK